jgi:hypothetical protein
MNEIHGSKSPTIDFTISLIHEFTGYMNCPADNVTLEYCLSADNEHGVLCNVTISLPGGKTGDVDLKLALNIKPNDENNEGGYLIYVDGIGCHVIDIESRDPKISYATTEACAFMSKLLFKQIDLLLPRAASPTP